MTSGTRQLHRARANDHAHTAAAHWPARMHVASHSVRVERRRVAKPTFPGVSHGGRLAMDPEQAPSRSSGVPLDGLQFPTGNAAGRLHESSARTGRRESSVVGGDAQRSRLQAPRVARNAERAFFRKPRGRARRNLSRAAHHATYTDAGDAKSRSASGKWPLARQCVRPLASSHVPS